MSKWRLRAAKCGITVSMPVVCCRGCPCRCLRRSCGVCVLQLCYSDPVGKPLCRWASGGWEQPSAEQQYVFLWSVAGVAPAAASEGAVAFVSCSCAIVIQLANRCVDEQVEVESSQVRNNSMYARGLLQGLPLPLPPKELWRLCLAAVL